MKAGTYRPGRVYYVPKRTLTRDEVESLDATGEIGCFAFRVAPDARPSLRVWKAPTVGATDRAVRRWDRALDSKVPGPEFADLLDEFGLQVVVDDHEFYHVTWGPKGRINQTYAAMLSGRRPSRRQGWRKGG